MQIALFRDDEHMVGLNVQSVRDQFNRHLGEGWENFVEPGGYGSQVIDDDECHTQIDRQMPEQPGVRVKATGRPAYANDGEVLCNLLSYHWQHFVLNLSIIFPEPANKRTSLGSV